MIQEELLKRNKEIVLMLGWKKTSAHKRDQYGYYQPVVGYSTPYRNRLDTQAVEYQFDKNAFAVEDLQFHSDWNWIMEGVEFIEEKLKLETVISNMGFGSNNQYININRGISIINETYDNPSKIMGKASTKKEAVFIAVSDFAKLYNEGKL
jgi:hypothetical protein